MAKPVLKGADTTVFSHLTGCPSSCWRMGCGRLWSMLTVFKYAGPPPGTALDSTMNLADGGLDSLASSITSAADKRRLDESPAPRRKRMTRGCCTALEMFLTLASKCGEPSYELSWGGSRGGKG